MIKFTTSLFSVLLIAALQGCSLHTNSTEVSGTYIANDSTRKMLGLQPGAECSICVNRDGTFTAKFPTLLIGETLQKSRMASGYGTWLFSRLEGLNSDVLFIDFIEIDGKITTNNPGAMLRWAGGNSWEYVFEVDSDRALVFTRQ